MAIGRLINFLGTATSVALMAGGLAVGTAAPAAAAGCSSGVPGDINGDRHAEVAVHDTRGGGSVHIVYGRPAGLVTGAAGTALDDQRITQDSPGVPGSAEREDRFGAVTAFGDFNDDGCADLAVSSPGENGVGSVNVLYGSPTGLSMTSGAQVFSGALFGPDPNGPSFGSALAVGDLDDDGTDDLAIGASGLDVAGATSAGGVAVLFGGEDGLMGHQAVLITRAAANVPGTPAEGAFLGAGWPAGTSTETDGRAGDLGAR